ncbi:MAG: glycosyltransferase family 4 protein [Planctomycetes bacterium]|nr:glycosyltransferase family 4 protein [Planctomycetota bacterium]
MSFSLMSLRDFIFAPVRWWLVQVGKLLETLSPGEPAAALSCFFATPAIGGAERVHADIVAALADQKPDVYFTEPAPNTGLLPLYTRVARVIDLAPRIANRTSFYLTVGRLARRLNRTPGGVVLGAFSYFFYRMLPYLHSNVRRIDLIHNFGVRFETFSLPHVARIDRRVMINGSVAEALKQLYREHGVADSLASRISVIENAVNVPDAPPAKPEGPLRVLYVGRSTPEKRVLLVGKLAAAAKEAGLEARFTAVGDVTLPGIECVGVISDPAALRAHYQRAHVLVLTSEREGFPMAVMEAMSHGVVPLCTDVGGLISHVINDHTGTLVPAQPEDAVVGKMVDQLKRWASDPEELARLSAAAYERARTHFSMQRFAAAWRELLLPRAAIKPTDAKPALARGPAA